MKRYLIFFWTSGSWEKVSEKATSCLHWVMAIDWYFKGPERSWKRFETRESDRPFNPESVQTSANISCQISVGHVSIDGDMMIQMEPWRRRDRDTDSREPAWPWRGLHIASAPMIFKYRVYTPDPKKKIGTHWRNACILTRSIFKLTEKKIKWTITIW